MDNTEVLLRIARSVENIDAKPQILPPVSPKKMAVTDPNGTGINGPATSQIQTTVSVLASSTAVVGASATRKSLILQNNDPSTTIYVDLNGGTATTTKGLRLNAGGGSAVLTTACPQTAVTAISTAGPTASNLLVIESF